MLAVLAAIALQAGAPDISLAVACGAKPDEIRVTLENQGSSDHVLFVINR
jgi:hypothetical protein